jgi:hypothetical protein
MNTLTIRAGAREGVFDQWMLWIFISGQLV